MKWISVKERMPELKEEIICCSEEGYISVEKYRGGDDIYCDSTDSGYATHWMPLPEPPES